MSENNILGVVLAGGKSKRFGEDKSTIKLNDKTLEFLPAVFKFRSPSSFLGPYGHRASSCGCRYRHNSLMQKTQWYYKENVYINFNI